MKFFKSMLPVLVFLGIFVAAASSGVQGRADEPQINSKYLTEVDSLKFAVSGTATDTLIGTAVGDSTTTVSIQGVTSALLHLLVFVEEGDQADSVEVNIATTVIDSAKTRRYSAFTAIDTISITQADGSHTVHTIDLLRATVATNLKGIKLQEVSEFRFRFDPLLLHSADTLHVKPYLDKVWEVSPRR